MPCICEGFPKETRDLALGLKTCPFFERTYINSNEVFKRLAHLQSLDMQMTGVEEVVYPLPAIMVRLYTMISLQHHDVVSERACL